jgi:hypothetical protein
MLRFQIACFNRTSSGALYQQEPVISNLAMAISCAPARHFHPGEACGPARTRREAPERRANAGRHA